MNARIPDDALPPTLDPKALQAFVDDKWDNEIIPALTDYIAIPAKSPAFDADWEKNAFIERVVRDAAHGFDKTIKAKTHNAAETERTYAKVVRSLKEIM